LTTNKSRRVWCCPLRRFASRGHLSPPRVTVRRAASRGADCPIEYCRSCRIGASGLRRSHRCLAISSGPRWFFEQYRSPYSKRSRVHPRVGLALLQSSSCPRRPVRSRSRAPSLGFLVLIATSVLRVHMRRASQARLRSAPSVSHALDGFLLAVPCRSISLCCHVQDFRSGVPPPTQLHHLVGGHALAPLAPRLCRRLPDDAKPRRVDLRTLFQVGIRSVVPGVNPESSPVSRCASSPSDSSYRSCPCD